MNAKLQGWHFRSHFGPIESHGEIQEQELGRYISWLIERGIHGLYPNGSTGEFTRFAAEWRRRIGAVVRERFGHLPRH